MAKVIHQPSQETIYLHGHHSIGRQQNRVHTFINHPSISKLHAVFEYFDGSWYIRDLSRNGTWINKIKIPTNTRVALSINDNVCFANLPNQSWRIQCLNPPQSLLIPISDAYDTISITDNVFFHPNADTPKTVIFKQHGLWYIKDLLIQSEEREIAQDEIVALDKQLWRFFLNEVNTDTHCDEDDGFLSLPVTIESTLDEEYVAITFTSSKGNKTLSNKAHHYLLYYLVQKKLADHKNHINERDQGWVDIDLVCQDLGVAETHINIQVYRLRKECSKVFKDLQGIDHYIERRSGHIRTGIKVEKVSLKKGGVEFS